MTINSSHNASIQSKDSVSDEQNDSVDVKSTTAAPTDASESTESSDSLPQGMPPADARPFTPPNAQRRVLDEAVQGISHVPPAASNIADSSGPGAPQEVPPADASSIQPPKEYVCPQAEDTPAKPRRTHSNLFRNGNLGERREIVVQDIHQVDIIPDEFFFLNLLPVPPKAASDSLNAVMEDLATKGHLKKTGEQFNWTAWPADDKKQNEDIHFKPFEDIFKAVKASVEKLSGLEATHSYRMEPNKIPDSDRDEKMRPDACFLRGSPDKDKDKKTSWYDIACVGEFKTGEQRKDVKDNIDKVIYGMHYIMASDPCRRFVTGFTVEKGMMSLWHASRSALYKCKFDFKKEPKKLVRLFIAFAFANANGQETGWDPTVKAVKINDERQYVYDVDGTKYVTKKLLAEYATDSLFGRGTRVFLVTEEGKDEELVLKDYWVDEGRSFELSIIEAILDDVRKYCGGPAAALVKRYIITILEEINVKVGDQFDHTLDVIMRGALPKAIAKEDLMVEEDSGRKGHRSEGLRSLDGYGKIFFRILYGKRNKRKTFRKMQHRRVVYKEYGTPIEKLKKLSEVIVVLRGVTEALKYIHEAKWVHRDISVGNLYEYNGQGLLADFEYAKRMGTKAEHEVMTGTLYFMASETARRTYLYDNSIEEPNANFFHNVVHDMESIHWVIFFLLKDVDSQDVEAQECRVVIVQELFTGESPSSAERHIFLSSRCEGLKAYQKLFESVGKDLFTKIKSLGAVLARRYRDSEAQLPDGPIDTTKFYGVHEEFASVWKSCEELLSKQEIQLEVKPLVILPSAPKREAEKQIQSTRKSKKSRTHEPSILEEDETVVERL